MMGPGGGMPGGQGGGPPKKTKNAGFLRRIYEDEFQVRTFFQILPLYTSGHKELKILLDYRHCDRLFAP